MSYKVAFIINPISGGGEGKRIFGFLPEIMNSFDIPREEWHGEYTDPKSFAKQLARIIPLTKKLIVVGGDGTMNLVLQSIADLNCLHVEVGIIPLGTGNDLSRAMFIWSNYSKKGLLNTIRKLVSTPARSFDLWRINDDKIMAAYLSIGVDAKVAHLFDQKRKAKKILIQAAWYNKLTYVGLAFKVANHKINEKAILKYINDDDQAHDVKIAKTSCCLIGNIPSYAGGAKPFSSCSFNDELLEVVVSKNIGTYILLVSTTIFDMFCKVFLRAFVPLKKAKSIQLSIPIGEFVQLDGEDVSDEFSGKNLEIKWAGKAQILTLIE